MSKTKKANLCNLGGREKKTRKKKKKTPISDKPPTRRRHASNVLALPTA